MERKNAIIIGASYGIGKALAIELCENGYNLALTARSVDKLFELKDMLAGNNLVKKIDVTNQIQTIQTIQEIINEMGEIDLAIINAGIGFVNETLDFNSEKETIDVNVTGFTACANTLFNYFKKQNKGHLVGISSIASLRGSRSAPAYNASKAYVSNYLEGLQQKACHNKLDICITDVKPGFVKTKLIEGSEKQFWVSPVKKAAKQIFQAIQKKKKHVYITKRWRFIGWLMKLLPDFLYHRI